MSKEIVEKIQAQFDVLPKKICLYIQENFEDNQYVHDHVFKPLSKFSIITNERWKNEEEKYNVTCLYALPRKVFKKIEKQNQEDFIDVWNQVLEFIWNRRIPGNARGNFYDNHLYLLVRTHLITDYGYFDTVNTNKLFRVKK